MIEDKRPRWSPLAKTIISLLLLALGVYLLYRFGEVLIPLILAVVLAYVLSPGVRYLEARLKVSLTAATLLVYLLLVVVLVLLPVVVIPPLVAQSAELNLDLQRLLHVAQTWLVRPYEIGGQSLDLPAMLDQAALSMEGLLEPVFGQTITILIEMITSIVWVIFILVVSFYLVKDGRALREWVDRGIPPAFQEDFFQIREEINRIWSAFFRGQIILALVVAVIFTCVGFLLGLPFALALGVLAGLLEFLPSIGHGIWLVIASLLALFLGSTWLAVPNWAFTLIVIGLHLFYQQFDLNYLIPRIIGRSVSLPPVVVILGIVTGAVLGGVVGILLAAPTIASARVLGRYLYANLFDLDPFPGSLTAPLPPADSKWWRRTVQPRAHRTNRG